MAVESACNCGDSITIFLSLYLYMSMSLLLFGSSSPFLQSDSCRNRQRLGSSLNRAVKPFVSSLAVRFRRELRKLVWARYGSAQAEPNRFGPNRFGYSLKTHEPNLKPYKPLPVWQGLITGLFEQGQTLNLLLRKEWLTRAYIDLVPSVKFGLAMDHKIYILV